jgi:cob(I)alamin adenosyltransferase
VTASNNGDGNRVSSGEKARCGYVQVFTGEGRGKTSASLGLLLRACGAGLRVCLIQFMKSGQTSEIKAIRAAFPRVEVSQFGTGKFVANPPSEADRQTARAGFEELRRVVTAGGYDLVIADEINVAAHMALVAVDDLLALIEDKPPSVELVLTGRHAHARVLECADLVTEMRCIKHYFSAGVPARVGIEM